jgi:maltose/moltooligosaccharide transporter
LSVSLCVFACAASYDDCDPYVYSNHHVWIRTQKLLNNDPRLAISFAGVLLLISAGCTLLIKTKKEEASE